jgi:1,4-alpha-glucan branching enzyme
VAHSTQRWAPFDTLGFEDFIIYQFHIGTFAGRGDQQSTEWATYAQIESKLRYVRELGFTCIQPLPVQEYAQDRSWGYNPATFFAPESSYGTPAELRHLVDAAHQAGLAVIFDVVYNHWCHPRADSAFQACPEACALSSTHYPAAATSR